MVTSAREALEWQSHESGELWWWHYGNWASKMDGVGEESWMFLLIRFRTCVGKMEEEPGKIDKPLKFDQQKEGSDGT